jgi:preprotein translocase subunit SecB
MKPSPIQLTDYFLTGLNLSANPKFDPKQEAQLRFDDFQVGIEALATADSKRDWKVVAKLSFQPAAEANVPYRFAAEIVGSFIVQATYREDYAERLVKTNGSSMLYGILREVIRDATARGPYAALILPSTSFYEPQDQRSENAPTATPGPAAPTAPTTTKPEA